MKGCILRIIYVLAILAAALSGVLVLPNALASADGGTWEVVSPSTPTWMSLNSIHMLSATDGWAVGGESVSTMWGSHGTVFHYDGVYWSEFCSWRGIQMLESVHMLSAADGWAVGCIDFREGILILHYDGDSWSPVISQYSGGGSSLYSVYMVSATDGWAVGNFNYGTILHYDGISWSEVPSPKSSTLYSVYMVSATNGWAVGGDGTIQHYDGISWSEVPSPKSSTLYSVYMVSATNGWAVGGDGTILYYDGISWSEVPSPTLSMLYSVYMVSLTEGWAVGGGWNPPTSVILHYDGDTWSEVPNPTSNPLNSVYMVSATEGWAVGYYGTLLHYSALDLSASAKSVDKDIAEPGDTLIYTIILSNTGAADASTVSVSDPIPANTTYVVGSASATSGIITGTEGIQWTGLVAANTSVPITFQVSIDDDLTEPTAIVNMASIDDGVSPAFERRAVTIVNGYSVHLPLLMKTYPSGRQRCP